MAAHVGIDLVSVHSVRDSVAEHAERYLARVYTPLELEDCGGLAEPDPRKLAARFAAKEATIKALRPGRSQPVAWRDIGVRRNDDGSPTVELSGTAATLARDRGVRELAVSLTHEGDLAGAVVFAHGT